MHRADLLEYAAVLFDILDAALLDSFAAVECLSIFAEKR
jgi:hypothetical protein